MYDYCYVLDDKYFETWNLPSIIFNIEKDFGFLAEARIELLVKPTQDNITAFFKNQNAVSVFTVSSFSLEFGSLMIEDFAWETYWNEKVDLPTKISLYSHLVLALRFKTEYSRGEKLRIYCRYIDALLQRKDKMDISEAERLIANGNEFVRKDSFESVD
jgi:hypothetical protein